MGKVKICGITNTEDATLVASLGAEYIGFNFWKDSPRKISVKMAKEIVAKMPPFVAPVGVFVDEESEIVVKTAKKCSLKLIQLHGSESPEYCSRITELTALPVIKAFRMADERSIETIAPYLPVVQYLLLDAHVPGEAGGTGEVFNWDMAVRVRDMGKPFFLAGGLTPENVSEAIERVQPFAVDVASGVERLPRRKDYDKMKAFIRLAHGF